METMLTRKIEGREAEDDRGWRAGSGDPRQDQPAEDEDA
jgi:hypothetical protein